MIFPKTVLGKTLLVIGALVLIVFNASRKSIKKEQVELEDAAKREAENDEDMKEALDNDKKFLPWL
tara:strand:- start:3101 stop:3298 length:198 start_codon:yes stop_codon:yes gene_type:complete